MWIEALSWEGLGHVADALGVVTAVPFLVTSAYFVSRARRYQRRLRQLEGVTSGHPVALAVSFAGTRIRPAVEAFCAGFGQPVKLVELYRPGGLAQTDMPGVLGELQSLKNRLLDEGGERSASVPVMSLGGRLCHWSPVRQLGAGQSVSIQPGSV
jgi:hypothetical protein